ncbi:protein tyrosine phosphatase, partial [Rhizobium leguminosarum]
MRSSLRWLGQGLLVVLAICGGYGAYVGWIQYRGNFSVLVSGVAYRSAQPTAAQIDAYVKEHGIKSIINLRGTNVGSAWIDQEVAAANKLGVTHYDFGMSARRELPLERAK